MLSESDIRADRLRKAVKDLASKRDESAQGLFEAAYLLVASLACHESLFGTISSAPMHKLLNVRENDAIKHLQELASELAQAVGARSLYDFAFASSGWRSIVEVAHLVDSATRDLGRDALQQVLDTLFYELFNLFSPCSREHHETVAHLARPLVQQLSSVVEIGRGPGELLIASDVEAYECRADVSPPSQRERISKSQLIRRIRFAAHGRNDVNLSSRAKYPALIVMDRTYSFNGTGDGGRRGRPSSRLLFEELIHQRGAYPGEVIAIISQKELNQLRRLGRDEEWLVQRHHLRAVITFQSVSEKGVLTTRTALYFNPRPIPLHENSVAFVDVRQLQPSRRNGEIQHCAALVGGLIKSWYDEVIFSELAMASTQAPRRVLAFVEEGLKQAGGAEVPGFFRFITLDELRANDFSLRTEIYVDRHTRTDSAWRPNVQIEPIMARLRSNQRTTSIYLIGNNGAGKSLALSDIAMSLAHGNLHSVGISFGSTDRFVMSPGLEPLKSFFTYSGARTSKAGTAHKIAMGKLGDMVKAIYRSKHRLACFEDALGTLGFEPRQYLVRMAARSTSDPLDLLLAEIHELTGNPNAHTQDDPQPWEKLISGDYKIAVIRREKGEVVVFDSLSSGEQQILTMIIKIVCDVSPGTTVLLDEPEISLHVAWQRQLPQVLGIFADALKCSFVVATHSPIVIASATNDRDHCFTMKDGGVSEITPANRRSVEGSLFEGFNVYTAHTHHIQERCAEIVSRVIAQVDDPVDIEVAKTQIDVDSHPQVQALLSLQKRLGDVSGESHEQDLALIKSAIAAVREVLTP